MKLNQKAVDALTLLEGEGEKFILDDSLPNFSVRLRPGGGKFYCIRYRTADGQHRRYTLGDAHLLKYRETREDAEIKLRAAKKGADPQGEKYAVRRSVTLADFWDGTAKPYLAGRVKASSLGWYEDIWRKHLEPTFGTHKVESLTKREILKFHAGLHKTPYAANRAVAALRSILTIAVKHEIIATNPAARIERNRETARERFLSAEETGALVAALDAAREENRLTPHALNCIRFLLYSGLRKNEAVTLRWDMIDTQHNVAHLPDTKGGARSLALSAPLLVILDAQDAIRTVGCPYVFEGRGPGGRLAKVDVVWRTIRTAAKMPTLRVHDLRHNAATQGALLGLSAPMLKTLMGHRDQATTARYIHLAGNMAPVQIAAEALGAAIQGAADAGRKVVAITPREIPETPAEDATEASGA